MLAREKKINKYIFVQRRMKKSISRKNRIVLSLKSNKSMNDGEGFMYATKKSIMYFCNLMNRLIYV